MKRKIIYLLIIILFLLPVKTAYAYNDYSSDYFIYQFDDYNLRFYSSGIGNENSGIYYVGQQLNNYEINSTLYKENKHLYGDFVWENPNYIIVEGDQNINIIFNSMFTDEHLVFAVKICGVKQYKKLYGGGEDPTIFYEGIIGCSISDVVPKFNLTNEQHEIVSGVFTYTGFDNTIAGKQDITWTFTPDDTLYEIKTGVIHINLKEPDNNVGMELTSVTEEILTPSLTASTLMLSSETSFDINLVDKPEKATYSWKSSNTEVATVNKSGVVQSISDGEAIITCTITTLDGKKQDLKSTVKVGMDDNFPVLSDDDITIDLNDTYKLNVENKESGSKIKFVSNDKTVAKVSTSGKITALKGGECVITVTITKGTEVIVLNCNVSVE